MAERFQKKLVWDFDGVIFHYDKWDGPAVVNSEPWEDIQKALSFAKSKGYQNIVVSSRCAQEGGKEAIANAIEKYGLEIDEITADKPPATAYIDDRAINFNGNIDDLIYQIANFKRYQTDSVVWKKIKTKKDLPAEDMRVVVTIETETGERYASEGMYFSNGACFQVEGEYPNKVIAWAPAIKPFLG